ncbi:TOMM system kinase/cyclase fusion protein [Chitinophaga sp. Hz27]|uniref:TOMM system kinase/cyclase fusion protein n=1 Tax=Chitinophaga sp. Hz27 TaxID=3347169 RepID=UPI0035D5BABF
MYTNYEKPVFPSLENYQLMSFIGEGASSQVFKARQLHTNQLVALKLLKPALTKSLQLNRFEREARICAGIHHPYIVKLLDKGYTSEGAPYVAFEYLEGLTLKQLLQQEGAMPVSQAWELMGQLLDALCCAHGQGVVHRDLKPENIIVIKTGIKPYIKVLDFGIGAFTQEGGAAADSLGTPSYAAPEQLRGEPPTARTDIYAWGLLLIECLTGAPAVQGETLADIYFQQLSPETIAIPAFLEYHPLHGLLHDVLTKNPKHRVFSTQTLYERFMQMDYSTLQHVSIDPTAIANEFLQTQDNKLAWLYEKKDKQQITVLCASISLINDAGNSIDEEILEEIQRDQLIVCSDIAARFGGFLKGTFADQVMIYFGYPQRSGNDARMAGRAALEILEDSIERCGRLQAQYQVRLDTKISLHSGAVISRRQNVPEGITANQTFHLLLQSSSKRIIVSSASYTLLSPYMIFEEYLKGDAYYIIKERNNEAFAQLKDAGANRKMYGRDALLDEILQSWQKMNNRDSRVILVKGEAGIGKSKLLYEVRKTVMHPVIEVRCTPEYRHHALYTIFEILRQRYGFQAHRPAAENIHLLEVMLDTADCDKPTVMPILLSWLSIAFTEAYPPSLLSPSEQRELLFEALQFCLANIAAVEKQLLIIEDLHWLDPSSLTLLAEFLHGHYCNNFMVLLSVRPPFESTWQGKEIMLEPLSAEVSIQLIEDLLGHHKIEKICLDYLLKHTDGVPFFTEELTMLLLLKKGLLLKDGMYHLSEDSLQLEIPLTLKELLYARLDTMGAAKETAQVAASIGREFSYMLLCKIVAVGEDVLQQHLDILVNADIIYPLRTEKGKMYIFRHALICEVTYQSQVIVARQQVHERIVKVLMAVTETPDAYQAETVARHLFGAGKAIAAVDWLIKSIQLLLPGAANKECLALCHQALKWLYTLPEGEARQQQEASIRQLLLSNLLVLESYGSPVVGEQLAILLRLYELNEVQEDVLPGMLMYCNYYAMRGDWKKAMATAEHLYKVATDSDNGKYQIVAAIFLGVQYFNDGRFADAAILMEDALAAYDSTVHASLAYEFGINQETLACTTLACIYAFMDRQEEVELLVERALQQVSAMEHPLTAGPAYLGLACVFFYLRDQEKVLEFSNTLLQMNEQYELQMFANYGIILKAWALHDLQMAKDALEAEASKGIQSMNSFWQAIVAELEIHAGDYQAARGRLEYCLSLIGEADGALYHAEIYRLLSTVLLAEKNYHLAMAPLKKASTIAAGQAAELLQQRISVSMAMVKTATSCITNV